MILSRRTRRGYGRSSSATLELSAGTRGRRIRPSPTSPWSMGSTVALPVYSGGLGMLSGDHLKTSSDSGFLLWVWVSSTGGLFQAVPQPGGFQQESYPENDCTTCPSPSAGTTKARRSPSRWRWGRRSPPPGSGRSRWAKAPCIFWTPTSTLIPRPCGYYRLAVRGDKETRIQQEILLGVGGVRALRALGITAACMHMNEGHSAFPLPGADTGAHAGKKAGPLPRPAQFIWSTSVFTTHTCVPAGR